MSRPADFIGLHFFSPVDKMPLLEIIKGEQTSDETLWRALDVAKQIKKTPIVVNDSRGFFTSRVIGTFINEGISMLTEGIPAATIEQASSQAGYPAPVLQLSDELNMKLMRKIRDAAKAATETGSGWDGHPSEAVIDRMLDEGRPGKLEGAGFYEYADGRRDGPLVRAAEAFPPVDDPSSISLRDLEERMMFAEAIETVKCLDEGVIESVSDANIGSIFGIGFPAWTGGVLQYINQYGDLTERRAGGPAAFVARCRELAAQYGDRVRAAGLAGRAGGAERAVPGRGCRSGLVVLGAQRTPRRCRAACAVGIEGVSELREAPPFAAPLRRSGRERDGPDLRVHDWCRIGHQMHTREFGARWSGDHCAARAAGRERWRRNPLPSPRCPPSARDGRGARRERSARQAISSSRANIASAWRM